MKPGFFLTCIFIGQFLFAHEGHDKITIEQESIKSNESHDGGRPQTWMQWMGVFHLFFLHFPLALINMTAISDFIFARYRKAPFKQASRFMLIAAAILSPLTAFLGLAYSYSVSYYGVMETFLFWHMWLGIASSILSIAVALIRELFGVNAFYYCCLVLLVTTVNITAFFGGEMTFGPFHLYFPLKKNSQSTSQAKQAINNKSH